MNRPLIPRSTTSLWGDSFKDMDDLFRGFFIRPVDFNAPAGLAQIKIDVSEKGNDYLVHAEIPGAQKEEIDVQIDGNLVSISAETKRQHEEKEGDRVLRTERYYGKLQRSFTLPHDIDEAHAVAAYENGVLVLTLPKKVPEETRKKLTVK
ncbi:MAG: Hsp20/alpha crystallin family protein [Proteobacteria bacterium]|nr:Hsp20/alpha crystallin family protein [Pseudomonadota bacterium]MCL2310411.1 Hsp20/alpha crystallin family protein [Pseudomonadota bacterium]